MPPGPSFTLDILGLQTASPHAYLSAPLHVRASARDENFQRFGQPRFGGENLPLHRCSAGAGDHQFVSRRRDLREDRGKRPGSRCLPDPTDFAPDQSAPHGVAHHGGCLPPGQCRPDYGGHSVLRLCPAGPERSAARAHHGQAGGQSSERCGSEPCSDHGSARPAGAGVLRHPGGSPLFDACSY